MSLRMHTRSMNHLHRRAVARALRAEARRRAHCGDYVFTVSGSDKGDRPTRQSVEQMICCSGTPTLESVRRWSPVAGRQAPTATSHQSPHHCALCATPRRPPVTRLTAEGRKPATAGTRGQKQQTHTLGHAIETAGSRAAGHTAK